MNLLLGRGDPSYVVTLVHGTFAKGAPWTRPGSRLWTKLTEIFGDDISLRYYDWSGYNSHDARLTASLGLQDDLRAAIQKYPHSHHFVIAHSHGGNITFFALTGDDELRMRISGVITMGTPFITCRLRDLSRALDTLRWPAMPVVWFLTMMTAIALLVPTGLESYLVQHYGEFLGGFLPLASGFIFSLVMAVYAWGFVGETLKERAQNRQKQLAARFKVSPFSYPPFLCGIVRGDEAATWLGFVSTTSGLPLNAYQRLFAFLRKYGGLLLVLFVAISLIGAALKVDLIIWCGVELGVLATNLLLYLLFLQVPAALLPKIVRAHRFGFGGESILDNWLNDISIEKRPRTDNSQVFEIDISSPSGRRHSAFYDNEVFLEAMSNWMISNGKRVH